jgi:cytochrome c oxidase subunit 3
MTTIDKNLEEDILREEPRMPLAMNAQKFILWLFIVTIIMLFAAWTSAYLVKKSDGGWLEFDLPLIFWINSAVILVSSVTMQWAWFSARKDNLEQLKLAMLLTTLLGIGFLVGQKAAWDELSARGIFLAGNPAASFLYVLTGAHAVHLVSGILFLLAMTIQAFRLNVHAKNMLWIDMCATYWHFLDFLWIYLFLFLLWNHN